MLTAGNRSPLFAYVKERVATLQHVPPDIYYIASIRGRHGPTPRTRRRRPPRGEERRRREQLLPSRVLGLVDGACDAGNHRGEGGAASCDGNRVRARSRAARARASARRRERRSPAAPADGDVGGVRRPERGVARVAVREARGGDAADARRAAGGGTPQRTATTAAAVATRRGGGTSSSCP